MNQDILWLCANVQRPMYKRAAQFSEEGWQALELEMDRMKNADQMSPSERQAWELEKAQGKQQLKAQLAANAKTDESVKHHLMHTGLGAVTGGLAGAALGGLGAKYIGGADDPLMGMGIGGGVGALAGGIAGNIAGRS